MGHRRNMSRRQRQVDQLRALCRAGMLGRAVDLAFEHFAEFGRDHDLIEELAAATGSAEVPDDVRRRFDELRASRPQGPCGA